MSVDIIRLPLYPGAHMFGAGKRAVELVDPPRIGDKTARAAAELLVKVRAKHDETTAEVARLNAEVAKLAAELTTGAEQGEDIDPAALLAAKRELVEATERAALAKAAVLPVMERYADAIAAAKGWRARLLKERAEFAKQARDLAVAAESAARSAEDCKTLASVIDNPHAPVRQKNSPAGDAMAAFLATLPKETE